MRRACLFLFAAATLSGQYSDFAVTDDGRLYFDSNLSTGPNDPRFKIYLIDGGRLSLFAAGPDGQNNIFGPTALFPLTSGDGSVRGYAINYPCSSGSCGLSGLPRTFFQLDGISLTSTAFNSLQISRNGRFLLGSSFDTHMYLIELPSQKTRTLAQFFYGAGTQGVANSGATLLLDYNSATHALYYAPLDGDLAKIPGTGGASSGILSPAGDRIAYERTTAGAYELVLTDPAGSSHRVIASAAHDLSAPWPQYRFRSIPSFANDGTLLYLDAKSGSVAQPMIVRPGGDPQALTVIPDGASNAIISGDARIAWLASYSGQLLRVHIDSGDVDEVIPETPYVTNSFLAVLPGSVTRMYGLGISQRTRFTLGDVELKLSEYKDQVAAVQLPWEYQPHGAAQLTVANPASPFLQRFDFTTLTQPTINFERVMFANQLQAAHQDFRGLVTKLDPALPGETVHVFARNMGPVDQPVATGQRSPSSPPARVTTPLACYLFPKQEPGGAVGLVVPFAGLSGGSIGVYQIDVTVPADWPSPTAYLQCVMDSTSNIFHGDSAQLEVAPGPTR